MCEPLGSVAVAEQAERKRVLTITPEAIVQLASFVARDAQAGEQTDRTAEHRRAPCGQHRRRDLDRGDITGMLLVETSGRSAVTEALSSDRRPRRTIAMSGNGSWFVADGRACAEESPDQVDVFTHSHRCIEAAGGVERGSANSQDRRGQVGNRASWSNDRGMRTEVERRLGCLVPVDYPLPRRGTDPWRDRGDRGIVEVRKQRRKAGRFELDIAVDKDNDVDIVRQLGNAGVPRSAGPLVRIVAQHGRAVYLDRPRRCIVDDHDRGVAILAANRLDRSGDAGLILERRNHEPNP